MRQVYQCLFFRSQGFRAIEVLRRHYDETDEDAYVLRFRLPSLAEQRATTVVVRGHTVDDLLGDNVER